MTLILIYIYVKSISKSIWSKHIHDIYVLCSIAMSHTAKFYKIYCSAIIDILLKQNFRTFSSWHHVDWTYVITGFWQGWRVKQQQSNSWKTTRCIKCYRKCKAYTPRLPTNCQWCLLTGSRLITSNPGNHGNNCFKTFSTDCSHCMYYCC